MSIQLRHGEAEGSIDAKLAGVFLSTAAIVFLLGNNIAEAIYPGYSVRTNVLSDLGAAGAPTMALWDTQLFVSGVLTFVGVYFFLRQSGNRRRAVAVVFLLAPCGTVLVSLFPENVNLAVHSIGALTSFLFGGIAAAYTYRLTLKPFGYLSLVLGLTSLFSLVAFLSKDVSALGDGGTERMIVYPLMLWQLALGAYVARGGQALSKVGATGSVGAVGTHGHPTQSNPPPS